MSLSLSAAPRRRRDEVVKSAARVMRILEYFDRRKSCANVHTVATALGYPPSSTGALLRSLATTGYLHHDRANRTYAPTLRVALLGSDWVAPRLAGGGVLLRMMARISERCGAPVVLAARGGDQAEIIQHVGGAPAMPPLMSLAEPGIGHALLAPLPEREIRAFVHRHNAYAPEARCVLEDLLSALARLRRCGFSTGSGQVIAAPLPLREAGWPYAMAVLGAQPQHATILREEIGRSIRQPHSPLGWPVAA